jgi:hypothetical protein
MARAMTYLVGTDEAGYGPNLGPLVISASVWQVPDGVVSDDLYRLLAAAVAPRPEAARHTRAPLPPGAAAPTRRRVAIADSKILYSSGKGWGRLEEGLWAAWGLLGLRPQTCAEVWQVLADGSAAARLTALGDGCDAMPVPRDADAADVDALRPILRQTVAVAGVRLVGLRSRAVFPDEFNRTVEQCGSKGLALSRWTLDLVARSIRPLHGAVAILCDKHGGRNHYLPLLLESFSGVDGDGAAAAETALPAGEPLLGNEMIEVRGEGAQRSVYRFGPAARRVEICFQAKAESHLPTALASMASKYLRELAMHALNIFWARHMPGLRPTAGYPEDARRFKAAIAATQRNLGIEDQILWRTK